MLLSDSALHTAVFLGGILLVLLTLISAISTFVLPRSSRSFLTRLVFRSLRRLFDFFLHFSTTYERSDAIMAYYAPLGLMLLLPTWYILTCLGYTAIYWSSASAPSRHLPAQRTSLFTLGFAAPPGFVASALAFSEGMLGLLLVALLIAYLPTMYSAFSRREQAVNMLEFRAGIPPSALEMLLRFNRIHGLDKLGESGAPGSCGLQIWKRVIPPSAHWSSSVRPGRSCPGSPPRALCWMPQLLPFPSWIYPMKQPPISAFAPATLPWPYRQPVRHPQPTGPAFPYRTHHSTVQNSTPFSTSLPLPASRSSPTASKPGMISRAGASTTTLL